MKVLYDDLLHVHYGQFYVLPPGSNGVDLADAFAGQANGLCGAAVRRHLFLITGLHTGRVHVRLALCDQPPAAGAEWEEIVEAPFEVAETPVALEEWAATARHELPLPPGQYRVRYLCRKMDQGHEVNTIADDNEAAPDSYELVFWPHPRSADAVLKQTGEAAAYWHATAQAT